MGAASLLLLLQVVAQPRSSEAQAHAVTLDVGLDHLILRVDRLDRGIAAFTALTGVTPKIGGRHPGRGTENALVSLGAGHYLELLAPVVPDSTAKDTGPAKLVPGGWALHTRMLDDLIGVLRGAKFEVTAPQPGSRRTPDGTLLEWRAASSGGPGLEAAPFFIEWGASTAHPSTTSPGGCRLAMLELSVPEPARLQELFKAVGYTLELRRGPHSFRFQLDCPKGRATFTT